MEMDLSQNDAVGVSISEVGLFGGSATGNANSGTLIARCLYSHPAKGGSETIRLSIDLNFAAS